MQNDADVVRSLHVAASVSRRDGGATTAILNTVRSLTSLGDDALIIATTADGPRGALQRDTATPILEDRVRVWFCRRSHPRVLKNSWQQAIRVWRQARRADIIHVHGVYLANSIWEYLASRLTRTPLVIQPHGTLEPYQEQQSRTRKRLFNRVIGHRILANADALIATSPAEAENLRRAWRDTPVHEVPLGAEGGEPAQCTPPPGHHTWLDLPREKRVVFLGRLAAKKRPDLLIEAWNGVESEAHLILAGPEDHWSWRALSGMIAPERRASVSYLGELSEPEVSWLLDRAGLLVLPSENENFGLVVTEAMSHGCAVLTTAATAAGEYVTAAGCGRVLADADEASLHHALMKLLTDPATIALMGAAAARYAAQHLSWGESARRLHDTYLQCQRV